MVLECDCGYVARGEDEEHLIEDVRTHAWTAHRVELNTELLLELTHGAGEERPRA